jgi:hypothetical protein
MSANMGPKEYAFPFIRARMTTNMGLRDYAFISLYGGSSLEWASFRGGSSTGTGWAQAPATTTQSMDPLLQIGISIKIMKESPLLTYFTKSVAYLIFFLGPRPTGTGGVFLQRKT